MVDHFSRLVRNADYRRKWRENRDLAERTLDKRRERYATDPDYRESIKESVRRRREETRGSDRKRSFNRDKVIVIDGVGVRLLSSGKVASVLGISPRTLSQWEKKNIIPINRAKDAIGRRWYPASFVDFLMELIGFRDNGRCDIWSERVKDAWQSIQLSSHPIPIVGEHLEDINEH